MLAIANSAADLQHTTFRWISVNLQATKNLPQPPDIGLNCAVRTQTSFAMQNGCPSETAATALRATMRGARGVPSDVSLVPGRADAASFSQRLFRTPQWCNRHPLRDRQRATNCHAKQASFLPPL